MEILDFVLGLLIGGYEIAAAAYAMGPAYWIGWAFIAAATWVAIWLLWHNRRR